MGYKTEQMVRALIERQRKLARSTVAPERFRTLWLAAELDDQLSQCSDFQVSSLMNIVQEQLCIFEPEFAICFHARIRLLRSVRVGIPMVSRRDRGTA